MTAKTTKYIVNLLRLLWILLILNNEYFAFLYSARNCAAISPPSSSNDGKFLLVADPQITDDNSYKRPRIVMELTKAISALYMKRSFRHIYKNVQPTDIFFMGDLMDSGRDWDDTKYSEEVERFHHIFPVEDAYYMVGNHDVGFGDGIQKPLVDRFQRYFGPTSYTFEKYGYLFVVVDTVSLSANNPIIRNDAFHMLETLDVSTAKPRILMTHVPLYRPPSQTCGPYRQSGSNIRDGAGYQYQNLVNKELSDYILKKVNPVAVFSGDDHDYCTTAHTFGDSSNYTAIEYTVPTFSMSQGLQFPGLMTLHLREGQPFSADLCWLPDQVGLFLRYGCLVMLSLGLLLTWCAFQCAFKGSSGISSSSSAFQLLPKEEMGLQQQHVQPKSAAIGRRGASLFFYSVRDVAWVAILAYIICICIF